MTPPNIVPQRRQTRLHHAALTPIARHIDEGKACLARQRLHLIVGPQRVAEDMAGAECRREALEIRKQCRADVAAPVVIVNGRRPNSRPPVARSNA